MAALTHQHPPSQEMSKANAEEAAATTTAATTAAATPTAAPSSGGAEEQSKGLEAAIPRVPEGVKPTSVAASLNRHCLAVSQPFTAGADLISSTRVRGFPSAPAKQETSSQPMATVLTVPPPPDRLLPVGEPRGAVVADSHLQRVHVCARNLFSQRLHWAKRNR